MLLWSASQARGPQALGRTSGYGHLNQAPHAKMVTFKPKGMAARRGRGECVLSLAIFFVGLSVSIFFGLTGYCQLLGNSGLPPSKLLHVFPLSLPRSHVS